MADWVIVVDDDTTNLKAAGHILSKNGMRVTALKSGRLLLEFVTKNKPDLILLDLLMPEMDGFETLRALRKLPEGKDVPVVFLSANEEADAVVEGLSLGAMDFLHKPFVPELLTLRARHIIELDRFRRAAEARGEATGENA